MENNPEANEIVDLEQLTLLSTEGNSALKEECCAQLQQTVMYNVAANLVRKQQRHWFLGQMATVGIPALIIGGISTYITMHTDPDNFLETFSKMGTIILTSILFAFLNPLFDATLSLLFSLARMNFKSYLHTPLLQDFDGWWSRNLSFPRLAAFVGYRQAEGHTQMASGALELFGLGVLENWRSLVFLVIFYWNYQHPAANQTTDDLRPEVQQPYFDAQALLTTSLLSLAEWLVVTKPVDVLVGFADPIKRGLKGLCCCPSLFGGGARGTRDGDAGGTELTHGDPSLQASV
jgi:hypothetical protein